jgi:hypothetical protein
LNLPLAALQRPQPEGQLTVRLACSIEKDPEPTNSPVDRAYWNFLANGHFSEAAFTHAADLAGYVIAQARLPPLFGRRACCPE